MSSIEPRLCRQCGKEIPHVPGVFYCSASCYRKRRLKLKREWYFKHKGDVLDKRE